MSEKLKPMKRPTINIPLTEDDLEQFKNVVTGDESIMWTLESTDGSEHNIAFMSQEMFDAMEEEEG